MRNHVLKKHNEKLKVKEQVNKQHAYKKITGKSNIIESDKEKENDDLEILNVVTKSVDKNIVESTAPPENETDNLENPVKCKLCIHRFANNHQLVQHMKQNHIQALIHEHIENTKLDGPRLQEEGAANVDQTEVKEESAEQEHENENDDDFWDNENNFTHQTCFGNVADKNHKRWFNDESNQRFFGRGCSKLFNRWKRENQEEVDDVINQLNEIIK